MPARVFLRVDRVDPAIAQRARTLSVADIHEALGRSGLLDTLMSPAMRPLMPALKIAGPALTAFCAPGDNLMMHRALLQSEPGDVLVVVTPAVRAGALWGRLATIAAQTKRLAGVVVQGSVRDVDSVRELGFPVWSTEIHAQHPDKRGVGGVNVAVACDGVRIVPGDLVVADGDGVVVVPRSLAGATVTAALSNVERERDVEAAMAAGEPLWNLTGAAEAYQRAEVAELDSAWDESGG